MKTKRYLLELGGESSAAWSGQPLPEAKSYDFDPTMGYPITFEDESAGEGHVERDARGQLWVTPSFGITFDEVKFHAFWPSGGLDDVAHSLDRLASERTHPLVELNSHVRQG